MHCASLGEYEQVFPVLTTLRKDFPDHKIVVSFFSPSGYEIKKNAKDIDVAVYLPWDLKKNAVQFLESVNPELILFVKNEVWPNFMGEIKKRQIPSLLISASFRENQSFFKWYGGLMRKSLFTFKHIFTQDEASKQLLNGINYNSATVSGDTRFDRVNNQLKLNNTIEFLERFTNGKTTIVFGSSWPADDALFIPFINNYSDTNVKFIIAPHKISTQYTEALRSKIQKKVVSFSDMKNQQLQDYDVFILDTIGYLSSAYSYANIAYVGGAAGHTGLHNILEPAVFGIPIVIGKNYHKFPEAEILIEKKGVLAVTNAQELGQTLKVFLDNPEKIKQTGQKNFDFIKNNTGAVIQIMDYIRTNNLITNN